MIMLPYNYFLQKINNADSDTSMCKILWLNIRVNVDIILLEKVTFKIFKGVIII